MKRGVKLVLLLICFVFATFILSGCDDEESFVDRLNAQETQITQSAEGLFDNQLIVHSTNRIWHIFTAEDQKQLVEFLEWLDRDKYEIYDVLTDGDSYRVFHVIYKSIEFESK